MLNTLIVVLSVSMSWIPPACDGQPQAFELPARHRQFPGGARGTMVISEDGIEFLGSARQSYKWRYQELREIRIASPTRLIVRTYYEPVPKGRIRIEDGPSHTFDTEHPIPAGVVQYLLTHFSRPIATAVMPPLPTDARARIAVKQHRDEGELLLYDEGLAYVTNVEQEARFWRFSDLDSVLKLDRYHLQITAYEKTHNVRTFTFELKNELPVGMYDALWHRVNTLHR